MAVPITIPDMENAKRDADDLALVVNGAADRPNPGRPNGTVTTRLGSVIKTVAGVIATILASPPQGWLDEFRAAGLSFNNKGDPGGNVMSVGDFAAFAALLIPLGTDMVQTSGATRGALIADTTITQEQADAHPLAIKKSANGRFFRRDPRDLWGEQFEMRSVPDKSYDSIAGLRAAYAYVGFCSQGTGFYPNPAGPNLNIGVGRFYLSDYASVRNACRTTGRSRGHVGSAGATIFACETSGIVFERGNTSKFAVLPPPGLSGADGSCIEGIQFAYVGPKLRRSGGREGECGIVTKCRIEVDNCVFAAFPSSGLFIFASSGAGGAAEGEASCGVVSRCTFDSNWSGIYQEGGDTNVWDFNNNTYAGNNWGHNATNSFLTSNWRNNHYKANGRMVSYQGYRWQAMPGFDAQWGTSPPGTDPLVWSRVEPGGPYDYPADPFFAVPLWQAGGTYQAGGPIWCANQNLRGVFLGEYCEGGQPLPVVAFPAIIVGGQIQNVPRENGGTAITMNGEQGGLNVDLMRVGPVGQWGSELGRGYLSIAGPQTNFPLVLRQRGNDFVFSISQADSTISLSFTGDNTTQAFGRDAPQKYAAVFDGGFIMGARRWSGVGGLPTTGYFASGEILFDQNGGNRVGWKCTASGVAGSTAVFKEFSTVA